MYKSVFKSNIEQELIDRYSYLLEDDDKEMSTGKKAAVIAAGAAALAGTGLTAKMLIDGIKANAYANGFAAAPKFSLTKSIIYSLIGTYGLNKIIALARGRSVNEINWASLFS